MAWVQIPNNPYWEYDTNPQDPGGALSLLWSLGVAGIRTNADGNEVYMNCRRVGSSDASRPSEISKTYWDNQSGVETVPEVLTLFSNLLSMPEPILDLSSGTGTFDLTQGSGTIDLNA